MAWRYRSNDNKVEVIVEPDFPGDLLTLAASHPVWIVDTPLNRPGIDAVWAVGPDMNLFGNDAGRFRRSTNSGGPGPPHWQVMSWRCVRFERLNFGNARSASTLLCRINAYCAVSSAQTCRSRPPEKNRGSRYQWLR